MRCLVLSDLHIEHAPFAAPSAEFDVVILAGDIHNGVACLEWARATFPNRPIVQVAGNHEFYDSEFGQCRAELQARARALGIHWLDDGSVRIGGVEFLGCTLWTDFRVFESAGRAQAMPAELAMQANLTLLADYRAIAWQDRPFAPADSCWLHERSRRWLEAALAAPRDGPRVVVSHHLPSWNSVSERFAASVTNAAFVSDLDELVSRCDLWVHGHTHNSLDYRIGPARVVCNPRGYPRRGREGVFENPAFDPGLVIEV